ncbi:MAG: hypothetical protein ACREMY_32010, partial [bacterium]
MTLTPRIEGAVPIRSPAVRFLQAFEQRVKTGLLLGKPHPRSNYRVTHSATGQMHVRAEDWWSAINVGLNELEIRVSGAGAAEYQVSYWRWAGYALGVSALLGIVAVALLLVFDIREYLASHPGSNIGGLSIDENRLLAWGLV